MKRRARNQRNSAITDAEVDSRIHEFFDQNYDLLREEGGHILAQGTKRQALEQARLYWQKLKTIAAAVTETEVMLALPGQTTPKGRKFVLEGVVDIVREGDEVRMYDLKTHEDSEVWAERELYEQQLNVYAHIWTKVRRQRLDGTAIIATRVPTAVRDAMQGGDPTAIEDALAKWNPVVELPFNAGAIKKTIADFGRCIDAIKDGKFDPPPVKTLRKPRGTRRSRDRGIGRVPRKGAATFAEVHCQTCDARHSCRSFQAYQGVRQRAKSPRGSDEAALDSWIDENLAED